MSAVELYRRPVTTVHVPAANPCHASGCEAPCVADMIYAAPPSLHLVQICGFHLFTLRHRVRTEGGALFYPLDAAPPLHVVGQAWEREMIRRRQAQRAQQQMYQNVQYGNVIFQTGTTMAGGFTIRFG